VQSSGLLDSSALQLDVVRLVLTRLSEFDGSQVYGIAWTERILVGLARRLTRLQRSARSAADARNEVTELIQTFPFAMVEEEAVEAAAKRYFVVDSVLSEALRGGKLSYDEYLMSAAVAGGCEYVISLRPGPPPIQREFEPDLPRFSTPDEFLIDVEGVDGAKVRSNLRELQRMIGYHSMSELLDAMRRCGLHEFVDHLQDLEDRVY
jgi:hypothetical protein